MKGRSLGWAVAAVVLATALWLSLRTPPPSPVPLVPLPPERQAPHAKASLEVSVKSGGRPVAGARVGLVIGDELAASGHSDESGELTLRDLDPGRLNLVVTHVRHLRHERLVEVTAPTSRVEVDLPAAAVLRARVLDSAGLAIGAATVNVVGADERDRGRCETSTDGHCQVGELGLGTYVVHAHSGRHRPTRASVRIDALGGVLEHTFRLDEGRALSGRVVDATGAFVGGARVGCSEQGGAFAIADDEGRFELRGLGDSPVNVFATAEGLAPRQLRAVRPGARNLEIRLEKPASIQGTVQLAGETKSLLVSVCEYDVHFSKEVCLARRLYEPPEREFLLEGLPSGTYDVVFEASGHQPERARVHIEPDRRTSLGEVRLRPQR